MIRLAVYSFPALMDVAISAILFVCMVRRAEMGATPSEVANLMLVWAPVYTIGSLLAGQIATRRTSAWILIGGCVATLLLAAGFLAFPGVTAMYVLMGLQSCVAAMFFTAFQVFMKFVDEGRDLGPGHSAGMYTCAWSTGFAAGPFIAGYLWEHGGWQAPHVFNAVLCVLIAVGIYLLKHHAEAGPGAENANRGSEAVVEDARYAALPDLAWMAWTFGGIGILIASLIRSIFPSSGVEWSISKADQGTVLCVLCAVQAVIGLVLSHSRKWMYRPVPIVGFGLFGVAGMALFGVAKTTGMFALAATLFGIYAGSFYFYFVFHSIVHPTRSARYVSINEAVVGVASMVGPFIGGLVADRFGASVSYLVMSGLIGTSILVQASVHGSMGLMKRQRTPEVSPASSLIADR